VDERDVERRIPERKSDGTSERNTGR